jgi:excisionase family DNA binding protein
MVKMLLRPIEVAECLGIGRSKAYELIGTGAIPSLRIGTSVRVPIDSLKARVASQTDDVARVELGRRIERADG